MINIYFSDTEAVEACICRLDVMWAGTAVRSAEDGVVGAAGAVFLRTRMQ